MKLCRATGKRRYPVEARAKRVRLTLLRKRNDVKNPHALIAYYCVACLGWHIGHSQIMSAALKVGRASVSANSAATRPMSPAQKK